MESSHVLLKTLEGASAALQRTSQPAARLHPASFKTHLQGSRRDEVNLMVMVDAESSNLSAGDHNSTKRYPPSTVLVWCFQICPKDLFVWGTQTSFSGKNQPLFPAVQATISPSSTEVAGVLLTSVTSGDAKWQEPRRTLQELSKTLAAIPCWHLCLTVSFCPQHHMQKLFYSSVH